MSNLLAKTSADDIMRRKDSKHTEGDRQLNSAKSYHKILSIGGGEQEEMRKVRSRQFLSAGGELLGDDSFFDLGNLMYDENNRLVDTEDKAAGVRIKHVITAKRQFRKHVKEEIGHIGFNDPVQRKLLRKMKLPNYPKKESTRNFLQKAILSNIALPTLTAKQIGLMINALKPKKIAEGVSLLVEGDIGKSFYIVFEGNLIATEKEKVLCEFTRGDSFGALALLYGTKRQMTVKTKELSYLWKLDSMSFKKILAHGKDEAEDYALIYQQLKLMPLLAESKIAENEDQLTFCAQNMTLIKVKKGEILIHKGDSGGDMMYFIKTGRVRCSNAGNDSECIEFMTGDYFGEGSLLHRFMIEEQSTKYKSKKERTLYLNKYKKKWKRAANVFAAKETEVFVLDYEAFKRLAELENDFYSTMSHNYGLRILKSCKLINTLKKTYRDYLLERLEILEYNSKDVIIQAGEYEKVLFLVVQGKVIVQTPKQPGKKKGKRYGITVGGGFGIEQFFDPDTPYPYSLVASGKVKIFAMTYSIFSSVFGTKLKKEDILKTGNPEVDESDLINPAIWEMDGFGLGSFKAISNTMEGNTNRASSKILAKICTNFEVDRRTSAVRRKKDSVKVKKRTEEEKFSQAIEGHLKRVERNHSKQLKSFRKLSKVKESNSKAQSMEAFNRKFKIIGPIGIGTFGMVNLIKLRGKKKAPKLALKVLDIRKVIKLGQQEAVVNERDILCEVKHPFILNYMMSFKDRKQLCILTEFLTGGELFDIIEGYRSQDTYMPDEHTQFYTACMVETFTFLHKKNVLYRDIKPENVMIDAMGYTRLVDFGFAKKCKFKTFTRCGTAEYFAPELLASRGYNKSVDLWGIGILTYEMMTGMSPFYSEEQLEMLDFILNEEPEFGEDFPEDAMDFIERLLDKEPNERLGMSLKNPNEVKKHPFLRGIKWKMLRQKLLPAPFVPEPKKPRIKSKKELEARIEAEAENNNFQIELKEKDFKGWYDDF